MERWVGRVAVVTGASCGIGAAISERLVRVGMNVIGCARNVDDIEAISQKLKDETGKLVAMKCDVTKEEDILAVFRRAKKEFGGVDVCINNAGLAHNAPLLSGTTDLWRDMLEVNVLGVAVCTREAFKAMKANKVDDGHIVNINSMSGHRLTGRAAGNFYGASKFAVNAMTEGVRSELRALKSNIRISQICPGRVATQFRQRMTKCTDEQSAEHVEKVQHLEANDVADAVMYQLAAPPHVQVHDIQIRPTQQDF